MNALKELLKKECEYIPSEITLDSLLDTAIEVRLSDGEPVIDAGSVDKSLYIVEKGILRSTDMDGDKERTVAFATPGTVFFSKHPFIKGLPSYYRFEACGACTLLKIPHHTYRQFLASNHDFALWILHLSYEELFYHEIKNSRINQGSAKTRLKAFVGSRPEIFEKVKQKYIASYLGITPEYLCRLKKMIENSQN